MVDSQVGIDINEDEEDENEGKYVLIRNLAAKSFWADCSAILKVGKREWGG